MLIASNEPDIMMFTEVIPKAQKKPILESQVKLTGYDIYTNFNYDDENLGTSGIRGVAISVKNNLKCDEVKVNSKIDDHVRVEISLRCKDRLQCGVVYRSPTKEKALIVESTLKICEVISEAVQRQLPHFDLRRLQLSGNRL